MDIIQVDESMPTLMALDNAVFVTPLIMYEWLELRCIVTAEYLYQ